MSYIRIVRLLPSTICAISGVDWGGQEGYIDEIKQGTEADVPEDALYAALLDDQGNYSDLVCAPIDLEFTHHFAGWDLTTFPRPTL